MELQYPPRFGNKLHIARNEVHFVQRPFLSDKKGSYDSKQMLSEIANPKFV